MGKRAYRLRCRNSSFNSCFQCESGLTDFEITPIEFLAQLSALQCGIAMKSDRIGEFLLLGHLPVSANLRQGAESG